MNAVDTNILFYSHDPRDPAKQSVASLPKWVCKTRMVLGLDKHN